jgi:hypothetical protein
MATNQDFKVKKGLVVSTTGTILSTVNAVSTVTGALQVAGGVGVGVDVWVGRNLTVVGTINASVQGITTTATNLQSGTAGQIPYQVTSGNTGFFGPGGVGQILVSDGASAPRYQSTLTLASTIQSISTNTGALQVQGGVGIGSNLYVGGNTTFVGITTVSNTTGVVGPTSGAFQVLGGVGINGGLNVNGVTTGTRLVLTSTAGASSTSTGALTVVGGVGINGGLFVGSELTATTLVVTSTATSTSTTTGAVLVTGGLGVGGSIYAGNIYSNGVLVGGTSTTASNATNLLGGQAGQVPYQLAPGVTTLTNALVYTGTNLVVNNKTVLTTASIIGQVGISVASTGTSSVYIAFIPGAQGLTADFGTIDDPTGQIYFDFGIF